LTEPALPPDLEPGRRVGEGRRSVVYRARYRGQTVAAKVYRPEFIRKYREKYGVDIARFEMQRNRAVRDVEGLRVFTARPVAVVGGDGRYDLAFLQSYVEGIPLVQLGREQGGLPPALLEAGRAIVSRAEAAGLHDLDLYYRNILVHEQGGEWLPVLHDFNLMPQHLFPPNPFLALAYKTGIRRKSHRDYRCLAQWQRFSEACALNREFDE
jgi:RIO-like serine/threonine protein kinase